MSKNVFKLSIRSSHRRAMLRNMATSFFSKERITVTRPKAKLLQTYVEPLITRARRAHALDELLSAQGASNSISNEEKQQLEAQILHHKRILLSRLRNMPTVRKLIYDIAPRFKDRPGGYSRRVLLHNRKSDAAPMSIVELLDYEPRNSGASSALTQVANKDIPKSVAKENKQDKSQEKKVDRDAKKESWFNRFRKKQWEK